MIAWLAVMAAALSTPSGNAPDSLRDIRAAIDGGRLLQADLMLGTSPVTSPDQRRLLADLRFAQKRYAEALELFSVLASAAPNDPHPASRAGIALLELGRVPEAEARLRTATALPGADWQAWNALGILLDGKGAWQESRSCYDHALKLAPREAAIFNNAGYSLIMQKDAQEARSLLLRAHKLDKSDRRIATNLQIAEGMAGYPPSNRAAKEDDAAYSSRLNNAGYGAFLAGNLVAARSLFARAIEASSTRYAIAERNLAMVEGMLHR